jgi:LacI family transcriptional regulator
MKRRRSVALLVETSNAYARGLLEGVIRYMRSHDTWSVYLPEQQRTARPPSWLGKWRGDGIIARIETEEMAELVSRKKLPTVDVSAARHVPNIPWVETDDAEISRLAADHLLERGFRNLAFVGDPGFNWSLWREQHFSRMIRERGCRYLAHQSVSRLDDRYSWNSEHRKLAKWLKSLPKPVGIMACYDIKAQEVLDVCRELDLAVPEQVAVIGADNDELLCNLSDPPLSSVIPNSHRAGYEAAHLLDRMMAGHTVPSDAILVRPIGIEVRQSTDTLAIEDADVAEALRFIRQHASEGINVGDVLKQVPLSRRVLESRFRKLLGRSPHEEIVRQRISRVQQLLSETTLPLREIASRTGFDHAEYLSVAFKQATGQTPSEFRRQANPRTSGD